jgi:hypothetical protein
MRRSGASWYLTSMYKFEIAVAKDRAPLKYTYLVGAHTVGIITPSRKRFEFAIHEVSGRPEGHRLPPNDGSTDSRLHPDEIAAFVVRRNLK